MAVKEPQSAVSQRTSNRNAAMATAATSAIPRATRAYFT